MLGPIHDDHTLSSMNMQEYMESELCGIFQAKLVNKFKVLHPRATLSCI